MSNLHIDYWPENVPRTLAPATQTLDFNLTSTAQRVPDKAAIVFYGSVTTYAELDRKVTSLAAYLQNTCQIEKGDRVGLYMQNSPQYIIAFYGIVRSGGVVVPINAMHQQVELEYICNDSEIKVLITAQDLVENVTPILESSKLDYVIAAHYASELTSPPDVNAPPIVIAEQKTNLPDNIIHWTDVISSKQTYSPIALSTTDLLTIPYTSGSTGKGKGCMHTHASAQHAVASIIEWFGYSGNEVHLGSTPLFHIVGLQGIMNVSIASGSTIVIMSRWNREVATSLIEKYNVTNWCTVPTAVIDLLNASNITSSSLNSMNLICGGGSAMPDVTAKRLLDLTGLTFIEVYGMTETMGPVTHNPLSSPKSGCVGIPIMNTEIKLLDPDTLTEVPHGEVGEVIISGPQVMQKYWKNSDANHESFIILDDQRYLRTGDLARIDDQGYLYIVDRLKRMINASGYKVWPAEVEAYLYDHPAIEEVCVIGSKDDYRGENVKAVAVLKPNTQLQSSELSTWALERMAAYKVPRLLEIVDSLPKSAAGKILWQTLQSNENTKTNQ